MLLYIIALVLTISGFTACEKYLDAEPNETVVRPSTLKDCQAMLDNYNEMNGGYPAHGDASADDYYLDYDEWESLSEIEDRENYIWYAQGRHDVYEWMDPYQKVFYANLVLETLEEIKPEAGEEPGWRSLKGSALFFRAYAFYHVAQLFAPAYDEESANRDLGIPLRLNPDVSEEVGRSTVQQTYDRILQDLHEAVELLPNTSSIQSRPHKVAAFAFLARTYLAMEDYTNAGIYADSCLKRYNLLMDFNDLDSNSNTPVLRFNDEVIFQSVMTSSTTDLIGTYRKVDTNLYNSYALNDLRRVVFFREISRGHAFTGNYDGELSKIRFNGLATDEIYLVRAECNAREGNTAGALADLNTLMEKRWRQGTFVPFTAVDADEALDLILQERRKELLFRGHRWTDLRRLNKDSRFAVTLKRVLNDGQTQTSYELPPNDLRYILLIPREVIQTTNMSQNPR